MTPDEMNLLKEGDEVRIIAEKPKPDLGHPNWISEMDKTLGKIGVVKTVFPERHYVTISFDFTIAVWAYRPEWVEHKQPSAEDPDVLLKKQRDDLLASIFGG